MEAEWESAWCGSPRKIASRVQGDMNPFNPTRPRVFVLLWAALALLACEPLREHPEPKPPPAQPPEPPVLTVTLESVEPVYCRAGQEVTIAATIEGGTPQSVSLSDGLTSRVET